MSDLSESTSPEALFDSSPNPERHRVDQQNLQLALRALNSLNKREREVLMRFYLKEQLREQICREMDLTDVQFHLIRSRAKARLVELLNFSATTMTVDRGQLHPTASESREGGYSQSYSEIAKPARQDSEEKGGGMGAALAIGPIVPVIAHAVAVFGDEHKASHWLATPLPLLDNRSPSQLLEGEGGTDLVEQILTRIEHNIPS